MLDVDLGYGLHTVGSYHWSHVSYFVIGIHFSGEFVLSLCHTVIDMTNGRK